MTREPHQTPEFQNAVTYTVAITYTIEGGARFGTADRRAKKIAERLANAAARAAGVVEVTATAGRDYRGKVMSTEPVRFSAANSGHGTWAEPDKLDRYVDPERERARESLDAENAAYRALQQADHERRLAVGCRNAHRSAVLSGAFTDRRECACVYCEPDDHYLALQLADQTGPNPFRVYRCVCGKPLPMSGQRCLSHRDARLVALDGDPAALHVLAGEQQGQES